MVKKRFDDWKLILNNAYFKIAAVIIAISIIGLTTVGDYGLTVDEGTELAMVRRNFELVSKGTPIPGDLKYFGTFFNFIAETTFQVKEYLTKGSSYNPSAYNQSRSEAEEKQYRLQGLADRIKVKHPLTFLISLVAYISVAALVGILCGLEWAFLAPICLALFPRFWGHTFFNPKDPPFAAMFTLCTLAGAYLVDYYLKSEERVKLGRNRLTLYAALYGILAGLLSSVRIGGFFILFFIAIAHFGLAIAEKRNLFKEIKNFLPVYILTIATWAGTTILLQPASWANLCSPDFPCPPVTWSNPASWHNPIGWFFATIGYLSKHPLPITVLFEGQTIFIQHIPQHYIPKWLLITIPVIFQILLIVGTVLIVQKYAKFSLLQRSCVVLVGLQILFLPLVAIIKHSSAYDEVRHFLFIIPGIAVISTAGLIWLYQKLTNRNLRIFAVTVIAILFSQIAVDMVSLHPYEYAYFNQFAGGLANARNFYDTDYWGLSLREGMEWLNKNGNSHPKIVISGFTNSAQIFADPKFEFVEYNPENEPPAKPFYFLAWPRWSAQTYFPECPIIHSVTRQNVPLTIVRNCQ
jgi:hypothetical protein